jgi:hypothetical protein
MRCDTCTMHKAQKTAAVKLLAIVFLVVAGIVLGLSRQDRKPLGEAPVLDFSSPGTSQLTRQQFLDGDFTVIKDVRLLPRPVLEKFTEQNGSRPVIANPGKNFVVGDVIYDSSVPRKRLIFAGVSGEKCFVHYEQGGRGHTYLLALFDLTSPSSVKPLWQGHCRGPAANISDLRSQVVNGDCL